MPAQSAGRPAHVRPRRIFDRYPHSNVFVRPSGHVNFYERYMKGEKRSSWIGEQGGVIFCFRPPTCAAWLVPPMKRSLQLTGAGLLVGLIALQFVPVLRNAGPAEGPSSLVATQPVPAGVQAILRRACYDCHSNFTKYPWYAAVQPVGWWLNDHVTEGKAELNFSEFATYSTKRAVRKLRSTADEVRERHMPLKSYLLAHSEAKLADADVVTIANWAEDLADEIESR
jgi:hypothetical protein